MGFHLPHEVNSPIHPVAGRLVASREHDERGVVTVGVEDGTALVGKILIDGHPITQFHTVIWPRRTFGLEIEAEAVGSHESSFGWAIAMETHVVETIFLADAEDAFPRGGVGGRETCLGETTVLDGATKVDGLSVEQDVTSLNGYLAEAEGNADGVALIVDGGGVELRMVLTPRLGARDVDVESLVVEGDMSGLGGEVGDDTSTVDKGRGTQLDAACYAVPVALGLIGDAMRVLAYADVLDAVVDADGNLVLVAEAQVGRDVILMRHGEGHQVAYFFAVDEDGGLDVRALEEKGDPLTAPSLRNDNGAAVGSFADEVLLGGEEERKFHLACVAVRLHEGVEVIRGIVKGACPAGVDGEVVAKAVGEERTGEADSGGIEARSEAPRAGEVEGLSRGTGEEGLSRGMGEEGLSRGMGEERLSRGRAAAYSERDEEEEEMLKHMKMKGRWII